jgi:ribosomal protein L22
MLPKIPPPVCTIPGNFVKEEPRRAQARTLNIKYSAAKLNSSAMLARKKHIYDALILIQNSAKKGGKIVKGAIENARANAVKVGM